MSSRVTHFEIAADDPERAIRFYSDVFGWTFAKWEGGGFDYWFVTTGPDSELGINGGLTRRDRPIDKGGANAFVCTMSVDDIDAAIAKLKAAGAPQILPKGAIPGIGWQAYYSDTEGNLIGVHQADPAAA